jgi:acyl dehydratase
VTILAWRSCDHTGPVFEGDVLRTELGVESTHELPQGGVVDLRAVVWAERQSGNDQEEQVLDWRFLGLMA